MKRHNFPQMTRLEYFEQKLAKAEASSQRSSKLSRAFVGSTAVSLAIGLATENNTIGHNVAEVSVLVSGLALILSSARMLFQEHNVDHLRKHIEVEAHMQQLRHDEALRRLPAEEVDWRFAQIVEHYQITPDGQSPAE